MSHEHKPASSMERKETCQDKVQFVWVTIMQAVGA